MGEQAWVRAGMSEPEKKYEGLCAGGPHHGEMLAAEARRVVVPLMIPGQTGISQNAYTWRDDLQMWIWDHK